MTYEPFDWWWSGKYWYCHIIWNNRKLSGCGPTKPQAVGDAMKTARDFERKRARQQPSARDAL